MDFLVRENFLAAEVCQKMADLYRANVARCQANHMEFWANRIMGLEEVEPVDPLVAWWMVRGMEAAIAAIEAFYHVPKLYADVITMVGWPVGSSMPLHADNAYVDGKPHALAHRLYSGVIYLTDDYEGGELFIGDHTRLKPAVGTLVSLPAGLSHQHGVAEVRKGLRIALTFFLTADRARLARELKALEVA